VLPKRHKGKTGKKGSSNADARGDADATTDHRAPARLEPAPVAPCTWTAPCISIDHTNIKTHNIYHAPPLAPHPHTHRAPRTAHRTAFRSLPSHARHPPHAARRTPCEAASPPRAGESGGGGGGCGRKANRPAPGLKSLYSVFRGPGALVGPSTCARK
jgi:hypothetical protein